MAKRIVDTEYISEDCEAYEHELCEESGRCNCGCHDDEEKNLEDDDEDDF